MIGIDTLLSIGEKVLDRVIPDPVARAEAQAKLAQAAAENQLGELQAVLKDMDSARNREIQIATSEAAPMLNKIVTPVLALGTVGLGFVLMLVVIFMEIRPESKDILIYTLGAVNSAIMIILSYFFGSSQGSKDKTDELRKIIK